MMDIKEKAKNIMKEYQNMKVIIYMIENGMEKDIIKMVILRNMMTKEY